MADRLTGERLQLHPRKAHVVNVRDGIDLLGYTVFPERRRLRNDNGWRFVHTQRPSPTGGLTVRISIRRYKVG